MKEELLHRCIRTNKNNRETCFFPSSMLLLRDLLTLPILYVTRYKFLRNVGNVTVKEENSRCIKHDNAVNYCRKLFFHALYHLNLTTLNILDIAAFFGEVNLKCFFPHFPHKRNYSIKKHDL